MSGMAMGTLHALSQLILTKLQEVGIFTHCADEDTLNSCLRPTQNSPNLQLCGEHQGWDLSAGICLLGLREVGTETQFCHRSTHR